MEKSFQKNYSSNKRSPTGPGSSNTGNTYSQNRSNISCHYCKKSGHTKDRFYKLHGYPAGSKFPKGRSSGSVASVCASKVENNQTEIYFDQRSQILVKLSKDQYEKLLNLLETLQVRNGYNNSDASTSGAVNLAGSFSQEASGAW